MVANRGILDAGLRFPQQITRTNPKYTPQIKPPTALLSFTIAKLVLATLI